MGGKATLSCDVAVTDVRLEVQLQQKHGESWTTIGDNAKSIGKYSPEVGSLTPDKPAIRQVFVTCASGTYRIGARGIATMSGVPSKSPAWEYSSPASDPCTKEEP